MRFGIYLHMCFGMFYCVILVFVVVCVYFRMCWVHVLVCVFLKGMFGVSVVVWCCVSFISLIYICVNRCVFACVLLCFVCQFPQEFLC